MSTLRVRALDANHDRLFGRGAALYVSAAKSTAQRVKCALLLILGEWFLDTSAGVPWFQPDGSAVEPILGKRPVNRGYAEATVKAAILKVQGVKTIDTFSLSEDRETRAVSFFASGTDDDGDTCNISIPVP